MNKTKQDRLNTVNEIIKEISSRSRRFFYYGKLDFTARFILKPNGRLYFIDEYSRKELTIYSDYKPRGFTNGGTCWGLIKDMRDFILKGGYTNHNHGYGGLYCPHWGYKDEDMHAIQTKAIELGYLIEGQIP